MALVRGIIVAMSKKDVNTKYGNKPVFSVKMDDDVWYGGIWKRPNFDKGDEVEFKTKSGQYGENVDGVVTIISSNGQGGASSSGGNGGTSSAPQQSRPNIPVQQKKNFRCTCDKFPIHPLDRQMSIIIQSSLNRATEVILAKYNSLSAAEQKKLGIDELWAQIHELTPKYADHASGQDLVDELIKDKAEKHKEFKELTEGEDPNAPKLEGDSEDGD